MTVQEAAGRALSAIEPKLAQENLDPEEKATLRTLYLLLGEVAANAPAYPEPEIGPLIEKVSAALSLGNDEGGQRSALLSEAREGLRSFAIIRNGHPTETTQQKNIAVEEKTPVLQQVHGTDTEQRDLYSQHSRQFSSTMLTILASAAALPFVMILLSSLLSLSSGGFNEGFLDGMVKVLATSPGTYGGTLQLMILPAAAALSVASTPWMFYSRNDSLLLGISFAGMFSALLDGLIFGIASEFDEATKGAITQYFVMSAGSIFIYIMLLIGLRVATLRQP
ncbi:hypothetical protein QO002_001188 [Pararhizobium capsulatum DSM 1112]|uniref:Uncharacterized protein n=1 Tax=Pararhizobium capsulatum DSM 1112 TaxID=1121113 RepID=A0ABU0BLD6_9HYPH|nr:hypothetical protein [Pararhizobium capsulatum]MDQ0319050.1 hypothetical protein [Pararhizobium capsulatum DSM 1112]